MNILQISTFDMAGGAERIAKNLFDSYKSLGHRSWMCVGSKVTSDSSVVLLPPCKVKQVTESVRASLSRHFEEGTFMSRGLGWLQRVAVDLVEPVEWVQRRLGREDFHSPGTWSLLDLFPSRPDIIHCHNLHGGYFDLRALPWLSEQVPVVMTLHDAWLLSGHCAHSFDCERWKEGCGSCPDLTIPPAVSRDATAYNWTRKQSIVSKSRVYVATPCHWLMDKVQQSMLAPSIVESRVIPNGVDLSLYFPGDKKAARDRLDLPQDAKVLLFTANGIRSNVWKDFKTMRLALALVAERLQDVKLCFIALGEEGETEQIGMARIVYVPHQPNSRIVAQYYRAADIYIHAARADTFPNTILEAMACGTPVVATSVGGIPEQVQNAQGGYLVPEADADAMASKIVALLNNESSRTQMGLHAADVVRARFDLHDQVNAYLEWYSKILAHENRLPCRSALMEESH